MSFATKVILACVAAAAVFSFTIAHVSDVSKKKTLCEQRTKVDRALQICATTPQCVVTLDDLERMVDVYQACSRP